MTSLVVLRPEPGAAATVARAAALGMPALAAPLFTVATLAWSPPPMSDHDAVMLTSANALRHGGPALARYRALPAYAVGAATAAAARQAGFDTVRVGTGDAAALLARMVADGVTRPLHLAGREHRPADGMIRPTVRLVYAAMAAPALPPAAARALADGGVALLHSPRAAALFATLVDAAGLRRGDIALAAISPAAGAATGSGWRAVAVAADPDDSALLAAAARLCNQAGQ